MKFLLDFFPVALFFIVYKTMGLYAAIYAMIGATALQMLITRFQTGKFEKTHLITFGLLVVFGGITLAIKDPAFIMWKVSVLYVVFALALILSMWIGEKTLLQRMLGKEMQLPVQVWNQLAWFWGLGFGGIALVNAYYVDAALDTRENLFTNSAALDPKVELAELDCSTTIVEQLCLAAQQSEEAWVNFKLFGTMGLTFLLIIITAIFINKYFVQEIENKLHKVRKFHKVRNIKKKRETL
jgi:intracellular septation protein